MATWGELEKTGTKWSNLEGMTWGELEEFCTVNPKTKQIPDDMEVSFVPMQSVSDTGDVQTDEVRKASEVKKGFTFFEEGDVLFAKITPCMENGKGGIARGLKNGVGFGSTEFHVLHPDPEKVSSEWLYYLTSWDEFRKQCARNMTGSAGQKRVPKSYLEHYKVHLPPLEEQRHIATILDKVSDLIAKRRAQLDKLDLLVKSRFVEMFGTINNNRYGFEIVTLQDVSEPIKDGTHQTPTYTDDAVDGYKFLSSKDVTTGKIDWSHLRYIPEELHRELYARVAPRKGDILLAKNGTTGIAAIVDRDEVFDIYVSLALIRPRGIHTSYLWAAINSDETKHQFDVSLKGIGVPNLHLGEIKKAKIILPPLGLQEQFAAFLRQIDKSKLMIQQSLDKLEILKKALLQRYYLL